MLKPSLWSNFGRCAFSGVIAGASVWLAVHVTACTDEIVPAPGGDAEVEAQVEAQVDGDTRLLDVASTDGVFGAADALDAEISVVRPGFPLSDLLVLLPNTGVPPITCLQCIAGHCGNALDTCANDADCRRALLCMTSRCSGADGVEQLACAAQCGTPEVVGNLLNIYACSTTFCPDSCQAEPNTESPAPAPSPRPVETDAGSANPLH